MKKTVIVKFHKEIVLTFDDTDVIGDENDDFKDKPMFKNGKLTKAGIEAAKECALEEIVYGDAYVTIDDAAKVYVEKD